MAAEPVTDELLTESTGGRVPPNTVLVGNPSKWDNPFKTRRRVTRDDPLFPYLAQVVPGGVHPLTSSLVPTTAAVVVAAYRAWLADQPDLLAALPELAGKDLACYCKPWKACHADWLIQQANGGTDA